VREVGGPKLIIVTPGVRSAGAAMDDQKRVATPAEAIRNGADYLVIGRQVTRASNPQAACQEILGEL
jgi:orotidine-5'-phosphate decarboxylase